MGKTKVKVVKTNVTGGGDDKDIAEMFNQMIGAGGSINMNICYPKYCEIKVLLSKLIDVLALLKDSPPLKGVIKIDPSLNADVQRIGEYVKRGKEQIASLFKDEYENLPEKIKAFNSAKEREKPEDNKGSHSPHSPHSPNSPDSTESINIKNVMFGDNSAINLNLVPEEKRKEFSEIYDALKKNFLVGDFLAMCNNLIVYRTFIENVDNLDHKFILKLGGVEFCPIPPSITTLNFKRVFVLVTTEESMSAQTKQEVCKFLMLVFNKLYTISHKLYKTITSPDIDVDEFVDVIVQNIAEVKKHIPRCDKAFKKIEESVHLLKDNFSTYYKDFMTTQNQMTIMEDFVLDVAKTTKADPQTTQQFRQIINFYRKQAATKVKDPRLKMLFEKVDSNFRKLDEHQNLRRASRGEKFEEETGLQPEQPEPERTEEKDSTSHEPKLYEKSVDEIVKEIGGSTKNRRRRN